MKIIEPRKLAGFFELLPKEQIIFEEMQAKIREIFYKHSFVPQDTPILELSEILLAKSGGESDKEIYRFTKGTTDIAMRYDLTVPTARYVAMYNDELTFPYRRFQIGKVFRAEKAQHLRFREFYQCDADIIGRDELPLQADAECIKLVDEIFTALKIDEIIEISNRKLLFGILQGMGLADKSNEILIALDKKDKIGLKNLKDILVKIGVSETDIQTLFVAVSIEGQYEDVKNELSKLSQNAEFLKGIQELDELFATLLALNIPRSAYKLKLSVIRGQNYYTGTIFETRVKGKENFSVVCAGGRYDNLTSYFSDKVFPGVGMSVGLTRLFALLQSENMLTEYKEMNKVLIIPLGEYKIECMKVMQTLREANVQCITMYENRSFKAKMKEANKQKARYVIIIGENEVKSQKYVLKDMQNSTQEYLSLSEIIQYLHKEKK